MAVQLSLVKALHIAIRRLDRIPMADLRAVARGAGRAPLVQAARRKLEL